MSDRDTGDNVRNDTVLNDTAAEVRARVRAFCAQHPPAATPRGEFLSARFDAGLAAVHYPLGHGGLGLPRALQPAADAAFASAGAPQIVSSGATVALAGTATDPNIPARPLTYA